MWEGVYSNCMPGGSAARAGDLCVCDSLVPSIGSLQAIQESFCWQETGRAPDAAVRL